MREIRANTDRVDETAGRDWSAWVRGMRRRRLSKLAQLGGFAFLMLAPFAFIWIVLTMVSSATGVTGILSRQSLPRLALLAFPVVSALVVLAFIPIQARRFRRIITGVPAADGVVCFRCQASLADRKVDADGRVTCACGVRERPARLREYWEQVLVSPYWAIAWRSRRMKRYSASHRRALRVIRAIRRQRIVGNIVSVVAVTLVMTFTMRLSGVPLKGALIAAGPIAVLLLVLSWLAGQFMRPAIRRALRDRARRCTACNYAVPPGRDLPMRCPECGVTWTAAAATRIGPKQARMTALVGLAMGAVVFFSITPQLTRWIAPAMPTGVLTWMLDAGPSMSIASATALGTRRISPEETTRVANTVLDMRTRDVYLPRELYALVDSMFLNGALDPQTRQRFIREAITLQLEPGRSAAREADAPTSVELVASDRTQPFGAIEAFALFGGWEVNGVGPEGRRNVPEHGRLFAQRNGNTLEPPAWPGDLPEAGDRARAGRLRAIVWVIVAPPGFQPGPVQWAADGAPLLPKGIYGMERVELEHVFAPE